MARRFDEVMIINPTDGPDDQGARRMRFHYAQAPGYGYYAQPAYGYAEPEYGYAEPEYGYYAEDPFAEAEPYGYYAEDPYGDADPFGWYSEPEYGGFAQPQYGEEPQYGQYGEEPQYGWYGEPGDGYAEPELAQFAEDPYGAYAQPELGGWGYYGAPGYGAQAYGNPYGEAEPVGYYAADPGMGGYGEPEYGYGEPEYGYGEPEYGYGEGEMVGYSEYEPLSGGWAESPEFGGYVQDRPPRFNAGCPMPSNVSGYDGYEEAPSLEGYTKPTRVSPIVDKFTPATDSDAPMPETFKPHW